VGVTSTVTQKRTRKRAQTIWNIICDFFLTRKDHLWYKNDSLSYNNKHGKGRVDVRGRSTRASVNTIQRRHESHQRRSSANQVGRPQLRPAHEHEHEHRLSHENYRRRPPAIQTRRRTWNPPSNPNTNTYQNCTTNTNPRLDQERHYRHIILSPVSKSDVCGLVRNQHSSIFPSQLTKKRE
jgi:outer membrane receptor protein involved in Fe transport